MASVTPELGRLRQEDGKFRLQASLDYKGRCWIFFKVASVGHVQTLSGISTIGSPHPGLAHPPPCAQLEELSCLFPIAERAPEDLTLGCPEEVVPASPQQ